MLAVAAQAQSADCNASAASPSVTIALPSNPFTAVPSHDGCWVFVSLSGANGGIAVLKRQNGKIEMVRVVRVTPAPAGIALTHDGKLLAAAANDSAVILDVPGMIAGAENPILGSFSGNTFRGSVYVNVSADDKLLFVSQESAQAITVIDLERARANGYKPDAIIGDVPVGDGPIALTFSPDGKWLYTTSEEAAREWNWPAACKPEGPELTPEQIAARKAAAERTLATLQARQPTAPETGSAQLQQQIDTLKAIIDSPSGAPIINPEGAVVVVDMARVGTDPAKAVAARIPAGCSAVRMAISPAGDRIYVTARNNNAVVAFDTAKLLSDADHARFGMAPVGSAPVPVAVVDGGRKVVAGNSNRFGNTSSGETLSVLDATKIKGAADAGLGVIPAGSFPREMRVSDDGHTLFLTNFGSNSLQVINVDHLMDAAGSAQTQGPAAQAQKPAAPGPVLAQNQAAPAPAPTPKAAASDPASADTAAAAEDKKNADAASGYVAELSGAGDAGKTRLEASRAAMTADTAAAAAEMAAAAVETDLSKATAASAAGDKAAMNAARDKAASDYSALLAADVALAKAATDLAAASAGNVAFYGGASAGAGAINDIGAQDASAAGNLLSAVTKGGTAGSTASAASYTAAAANEATAMKDANTIADLAPPRAPAFQAVAKAEAEAQSAATAAAAGGSASAAAAALAAAATAAATADGPGNPYAGAVEIAAAAVANAASATISAQQALDRLKTLK